MSRLAPLRRLGVGARLAVNPNSLSTVSSRTTYDAPLSSSLPLSSLFTASTWWSVTASTFSSYPVTTFPSTISLYTASPTSVDTDPEPTPSVTSSSPSSSQTRLTTSSRPTSVTSTRSSTAPTTPASTRTSTSTQPRPTSTTTTSRQEEEPTPTSTSLPTLSNVFSTTVTGKNGEQSVEIPPFFTSIYASTGWDGSIITITNVAVNPTGILSPPGNRAVSPFFRNRVAVAGVFLVAGVALMSLVLLSFFSWRRRRHRRMRRQRFYQRRAAAQQNRRPFEDDEAAAGMPAAPGSETIANSASASGSEAELQMEMSQRPLSPNNRHSALYASHPQGLGYGSSLSSVTATQVEPAELFVPPRSGRITPEGMNESCGSLPTFDYALEPSSSKFPDGDNSFHESEYSNMQDHVDYTRRVWHPQPSSLRADLE